MPFGREGEYGEGGGQQLTVGKVEYDPRAVEETRARWKAPLTMAASVAGPGGMALREATRVGVLAPGVRELVKQRSLEAALRDVRSPRSVEALFGL